MTEPAADGASANATHRLAWLDHIAFELFKSTGRSQLMQCIWFYDRDVDRTALEITRNRLATLSINRLIEPSTLPLARPRWVRPSGPPGPIEEDPRPLPRSQLMNWANRMAQRRIDPVTGPAWRMAMQRFDDGSTAVSIIISHAVIDGLGGLRAIDAAIRGLGVVSRYLAKGQRGQVAGAISDVRQIFADAPRTIRALAMLAWSSWREGGGRKSVAPARPTAKAANPAEIVELAAVTVSVEAQQWDACSRRLGGHPNTLLPGFVATLAMRLGRRRASDGAVSLMVPVDTRRGLEDERAIAIAFRSVLVAPEGLATDLSPLSASLRAMLRGVRKTQSDPFALLLPAVAWMPRRITTALVNRLFTYGDDRPVSCSGLGNLPEGLALIDGAPCTRMMARAVDVNVSRADLERSHGHLVVVGSRICNTVTLCIEACQLDPSPTTTAELHRATMQTLADFDLSAAVET